MKRTVAVLVSADLERNLFGIRKNIRDGDVSEIHLFYNKLDNVFGKISRKMTKKIEKKVSDVVACKKTGINPESFEECFGDLYSALSKMDGETLVDISSTTKIASAAVISLASILNIIPYIVTAEREELKKLRKIIKEKYTTKGAKLYEIPVLRQREFLNDFERQILRIIRQNNGKMNSMTDLLKKLRLPVSKKELIKLKYWTDHLKYKQLVETEKTGRAAAIKSTFFGRTISKNL